VLGLLGSLGIGSDVTRGGRDASEVSELLWAELGLPDGGLLTEEVWAAFMTHYLRRWGVWGGGGEGGVRGGGGVWRLAQPAAWP
jgi:hypothetical protein